jgi:hypothetical protein
MKHFEEHQLDPDACRKEVLELKALAHRAHHWVRWASRLGPPDEVD